MAKYKLHLEDDFEFDLIGICSNHTDYRLSWGINSELGINLEKVEDFTMNSKKEGENLYSFYAFYDEMEHIEYYLLKNISDKYQRLIPEKDQIDYFLIIKNNFTKDLSEVLTCLRSSNSISTAFIFKVEELKSKANLIF